MRIRNCALIATLVLFMMVGIVTSNSQVFAQSPCVAQVNYPVISADYSPNIGMTVPVTATCSYSGQLFAVGDAYDTTTNTDLGSVNTGLSSTGGGSFNGQLNFYLPTTVQGHTIQISVSIYNAPFGNNSSAPLATTSQSVTIDGSYNQDYQNAYSSCQPGYSYTGGNCYPPSYNNGSNYSPPNYNTPNYNGPPNYNTPNYNYGYCQPGYSYIGAGCYPPNNGYCSPNYSYAGGSCYPPNYSSNYYNYNNYYAYCPPSYYIGSSCSYPGSYYYSLYRYHGSYYYHWYYRHRHW